MKRTISTIMLGLFLAIGVYGQKPLFQTSISDTVCCSLYTYFTSPTRADDIVDLTVFTVVTDTFPTTGAYENELFSLEGSIDGVTFFDFDSVLSKVGDATISGVDSANAETLPGLVVDYFRAGLSVDAADSILTTVSFVGNEAQESKRVFYGYLKGSNGFQIDTISDGDTTYFILPQLSGKYIIGAQLGASDHTGTQINFWSEVSYDGTHWTRARSAGATLVGAKAPDNGAEYFSLSGTYPYVRLVYEGVNSASNEEVTALVKVLKLKY